MQLFLLNFLLTALWLALTRSVTTVNLFVGFGIGYLITAIFAKASGSESYFLRFFKLVEFIGYFIRIVIQANLIVAWEVITPGFSMTPRIIRYSVKGLTPVQVATFSNILTLTPGTLSADIHEKDECLTIHAMYAKDKEALIRSLDDIKDHMLKGIFYE